MICPRCKSEVAEGAAACPRCRAPLRLGPEPAAAQLDRDLDLDRRVDRPSPPGNTISAPWRAPEPPPAPPRVRPPITTPAPWMEEPAAPPPPEPSFLDAVHPDDLEIVERPEGDTAPGPPPPAPVPPARRDPPAVAAPPPRPAQARLPFPPEVHMARASTPRRLLSWLADGAAAGALAWLLVAGGAGLDGAAVDADLLPQAILLAALLHFVHAALGCALAGCTLGKWMLGLAVVGGDGRRPGPGRSAARAALSLLSAAALGLGLLLALFDRKGRTLHDLVAGTAVVRAP